MHWQRHCAPFTRVTATSAAFLQRIPFTDAVESHNMDIILHLHLVLQTGFPFLEILSLEQNFMSIRPSKFLTSMYESQRLQGRCLIRIYTKVLICELSPSTLVSYFVSDDFTVPSDIYSVSLRNWSDSAKTLPCCILCSKEKDSHQRILSSLKCFRQPSPQVDNPYVWIHKSLIEELHDK